MPAGVPADVDCLCQSLPDLAMNYLLTGSLLCMGLSSAHQYNRGFYPYPPSGWPSHHYHGSVSSGNPVMGPWGTSHKPGSSPVSTTTALADRLGTAESVYPYPAWGQNSVVNTVGCKVGTKVYKVGDKWTPEDGCGRVSCMGGGKTTTLECPKFEPSDRCASVDPDPRQPWPLCCPQLRC